VCKETLDTQFVASLIFIRSIDYSDYMSLLGFFVYRLLSLSFVFDYENNLLWMTVLEVILCVMSFDSVSSRMIWQLSTGFAVICTLVQSACCYDTSSDVSNLPWPPSVMSSLLSICTIVCIIAVIMACAKWCPRETAEFKVIFAW